MSDPFKLPADLSEGLNDGLKIDGFDAAQAYSAGGRAVAVAAVAADGQLLTLYGKSPADGSIVERDWAGTKRYVLSFSVVSNQIKGIKALVDGLTHDERALRGSNAEAGFGKDVAWSTAVVGTLEVGGVVLRPQSVSFKVEGDTGILTFVEDGESAKDGDADHLNLSMALENLADTSGQFEVRDLAMRGAMLFDRFADGGWEKVSPLWLATTRGCLRLDGPGEPLRDPDGKPIADSINDVGAGTLPYALAEETRPVDGSVWFSRQAMNPGRVPVASLPANARALLLLDNSGRKTLTVRFDRIRASIELTVERPALDLMLPGLACDGASLRSPLEPPSAAALRSGPSLHLVASALLCDVKPGWKLALDALPEDDLPRALRITRDEVPGRPYGALHFQPVDDWVRPKEAAVNGEDERLSALRVLLPTPRRVGAVLALRLGPSGLAAEDSAFDRNAAIGHSEALQHGPLASFKLLRDGDGSDRLETKESSDKAPNEPAVLRPEYRRTPVLDKDGLSKTAPFSSTYALSNLQGAITDDTAIRQPRMTKPHTSWRLRPDDENTPQLRRDATDADADFGWWDSKRFFRRGFDGDPRLEWMQYDKEGASWRLTPWLRLSDDSLVVPEVSEAAFDDIDEPVSAGLPADGWKIPQSQLGSQGQGLSLFSVHELKGPLFRLMLQGVATPVAEVSGAAAEGVVNRLVFAGPIRNGNDPRDLGPLIDVKVGAVKLSRLNCLFLEVERRGAGFRMVRGMIGWSASQCFGMKAAGDLQYSEFYDRARDDGQPTLEFNGAVEEPKRDSVPTGNEDFQYKLFVFFWASVLAPNDANLRVTCRHDMTMDGVERTVVSIQDAELSADRQSLDLSADIVLYTVNSAPPEYLDAPDTWEPSRRGLFTATLDKRVNLDQPRAFIKIRSQKAPNVRLYMPEARVWFPMRLVPSFYDSIREIMPWFSADSGDRRNRRTWLPNQLLRTRGASAEGTALDVTVHMLSKDVFASESFRACTLTDGGSYGSVIAQWVPSPLAAIALPALRPTLSARESKLWLFDPFPRVVAQWPASPSGDPKPVDDRDKATNLLGGIGWSREAVLEKGWPPTNGVEQAPPPQWEVIDSPLLNRDAAIGWLAWPFNVEDSKRPEDVLPLTRQVVHLPQEQRPEASVQVLFDCDVEDGQETFHGLQRYVADPPNREASAVNSETTALPGGVLPTIGFHPLGLRVGTCHLSTIDNAGTTPPPTAFDGPAVDPELTTKHDLTIVPRADGSGDVWLSWAREAVQLNGVTPADSQKDGAVAVDLKLPGDGAVPWSTATIEAAPDGLLYRDASGWLRAVLGTPVHLTAPYGKLSVALAVGALWSEIRISLRAGDTARASQSWFATEGNAVRLAGLFINDELRQFGYEPVWFRPEVDTPGSWTRIAGAVGPDPNTSKIEVATIDLTGATTLYKSEG